MESPPATTIAVGDLLAFREDFGALVPAPVRFVTLGCDVQDEELVGLLVGWAQTEEAWLLGAVTFTGDPSTDTPWAELGYTARDDLAIRRRRRAADQCDPD